MENLTYLVLVWALAFGFAIWLSYNKVSIANIFSNLTSVLLSALVVVTGIGFFYYLYHYYQNNKAS